jgi:hypothetical protein
MAWIQPGQFAYQDRPELVGVLGPGVDAAPGPP